MTDFENQNDYITFLDFFYKFQFHSAHKSCHKARGQKKERETKTKTKKNPQD